MCSAPPDGDFLVPQIWETTLLWLLTCSLPSDLRRLDIPSHHHAGARVGRAGPRHGDCSVGCASMCSSASSARAAKGIDELLRQPKEICVSQVDISIFHTFIEQCTHASQNTTIVVARTTMSFLPSILENNQVYCTFICARGFLTTQYLKASAHMDNCNSHALKLTYYLQLACTNDPLTYARIHARTLAQTHNT